MSKRKRGEAKDLAKPAEKKVAPVVVPFKPRRKLFVALMALLAIWSAALLVMYFKTVYPHRTVEPKPASKTFAQARAARG